MPTSQLENASVVQQIPVIQRQVSPNLEYEGQSSGLNRQRLGALAMALVSIVALIFRRAGYDSWWVIGCESLLGGAALALAGRVLWRQMAAAKQATTTPKLSFNSSLLTIAATTYAIVNPWLLDFLARAMGSGNAVEIIGLSSLGWGAVAAAVLARSSRNISISVICSGFLTMFTTFISESSWASWFAYLWIAMCLWWLVTNHWERLELTDTSSVQSLHRTHALHYLLGVAAFVAATLMIGNSIPVIRQSTAELMPTSGGTGDYDSAANRGVGNGDALIAAREHATSFGAVETDLFLDSDQPSLFDVLSDEFGEARKKDRIERAQALSPEETKSQDGRFAEANRSSGGQFSTDREPPKRQPVLSELTSDALMFWEGAAGAHLAVERFDHFDGVDWHQLTPITHAQPETLTIEDRMWFHPAQSIRKNDTGLRAPFTGAFPEALKFTRFRSATIPSRAGIQLWSIDQLNRPDFFDYSSDDCLSMPGRKHVPDYTVVRFVNSRIDREQFESMLQQRYSDRNLQSLARVDRNSTTVLGDQLSLCYDLARELSAGADRGWPQIMAIVQGVRSGFELDRDFRTSSSEEPTIAHDGESTGALGSSSTTDIPLARFLHARRGPSYMFATATAMMLDSCGYETRLVAGFYVDPIHYLPNDNEYAIHAHDAHVWVEVHAGDGAWIPLEPTPGYRSPSYTAGWWYHIKQAKFAILFWLLSITSTALLIYLLRVYVIEFLCWMASPITELIPDRYRIVWLGRLLDLRMQLLGYRRPCGRVPRAHLAPILASLPADHAQPVRSFLDACDALRFGTSQTLSQEQRSLLRCVWNNLHCFRLRRALKGLTVSE